MQSYVTVVSFVLERVVEPFESRMGVFTLETQRTSFILSLKKAFAIIRPIDIAIGRSAIVLGFVCIDALSPVVLHIFLRTISCLVLVHIEHIWIHSLLQILQVFSQILLNFISCSISHIERHYQIIIDHSY